MSQIWESSGAATPAEETLQLDPRVDAALRELPEKLDSLEAVTRLRRSLPAPWDRAAARLYSLRHRARTRLAPELRFLSEKGIEQASERNVARYRAERIAAWNPEAAVLDATAGLGSDSLALRAAGLARVVAADVDPVVVRLLRRNVEPSGAWVVCADARRGAVRADCLLLDPDRRPSAPRRSARTSDPAAWSPPWPACLRALEGVRAAAVKLPPALPLERLEPALDPGRPHSWQWISVARELREICLWIGELAHPEPGAREALALDRDGTQAAWSASPRTVEPLEPEVARAVPWIAEPDPAVIRSGLLGALAFSEGLRPLGPNLAYIGGEHPPRSRLLRGYEVKDRAPLDRKRVRAMLGRHGVGPVTVKKRGHPDDAETLAQRFRGQGEDEGLLIVARLATTHHAYLVRRSSGDGPRPSSSH